MSDNKVYTAIGLMSGTSLDGEIDVALIETDGEAYVKPLDFKPFPYEQGVRDKVRACFGRRGHDADTMAAEQMVTDLHIAAVQASGFKADIIGFHGQTITHAPEDGFTWQLGDGQRLANETGMDVVYNLRKADVEVGGQGAPLIPAYHAAMAAGQEKPLAVLNLGGVANVTYIGADGALIACDTGPANALLDDYIHQNTGKPHDEGGAIALSGTPDTEFIKPFLEHPYFSKEPPKSLDRNEFTPFLKDLPEKFEDAVSTLAAITVLSVARSVHHFPDAPKEWLVCGGGRKNNAIMQGLQKELGVPVRAVEEAGWNGDAIEAQGFAYLAVRSALGYPLTFPKTTGVERPQPGGVLCRPDDNERKKHG